MKKIALATLALTTVLASAHAGKHMARNVMSHHPSSRSSEFLLKNWRELAFERGEYTGVASAACGLPHDADLNAMYVGVQGIPFKKSDVKPTSLTGSDKMTFYDPGCAVRWESPYSFLLFTNPKELERILEMEKGEAVLIPQKGGAVPRSRKPGDNQSTRVDSFGISTDILTSYYTLSIGKDERGLYLSFYDAWDFLPGNGGFYDSPSLDADKIATTILPLIGKPVRFYKRFYFSDHGVEEEHIRLAISAEFKELRERMFNSG